MANSHHKATQRCGKNMGALRGEEKERIVEVQVNTREDAVDHLIALKAWQRIPVTVEAAIFASQVAILSREDLRSSCCSMESLGFVAGPPGGGW